jgi:hypothetical protein
MHVGGIFDSWLGHVHGSRHAKVLNFLFNSKLCQFNFGSSGQTRQGFVLKNIIFKTEHLREIIESDHVL